MGRRFDPEMLPESPDLAFEIELWDRGIPAVAGIDEAGRGALAGPVSAAAVILPQDRDLVRALEGVRDSKQMTPQQREAWAARLPGMVLAWAVGFASHEEIDLLGILPATRLAARRAIDLLCLPPSHLLLDYITIPDCNLPQTPIVKGDARCLSIAAASVFAKTARDAVMRRLDADYPGYHFFNNKGYGTAEHREAIERLGQSPIHRKSFRNGRQLQFEELLEPEQEETL